MALVFKERVKENTSTTGTGTLTLTPIAQFQAFSGIGNGNQTYYGLQDGDSLDWEVGVGTYTLSGTTLSRDSIIASSNGGNHITISGTSTVFCTYPAGKSVFKDLNDKIVAGSSGIIFTGDNIALGSSCCLLASGYNNVFIGNGAGYTSDSSLQTFVGNQAGSGSKGCLSSFMGGQLVGVNCRGANKSVFIGAQAGRRSTSIGSGVVIGQAAGLEASGGKNIFIGSRAGIRVSGDRNIEISTNNGNVSIIGANSRKIYIEETIAGDTNLNKIAIGNVHAAHLSPEATLQLVPKASADIALKINSRPAGAANAIEASGKCHFRSQYSTVVEPTGETNITLDLDQSNFFNITMDSDKTLEVSNADVGQTFIVNIRQDSAVTEGVGWGVTWWSNIKWAGQLATNTPPATSDSGNLVDTFGFTIPSGNKYYGYIRGTGIYDPL